MAKRLIDPDIWDSLLDVSEHARFLYMYLTTNCNNAGLITPHRAKIKFYCGAIDVDECLNELIEINYVQILPTGKAVLPVFLLGNFSDLLNSNSKPVVSAREELIRNHFEIQTLYKPFANPLERVKEKDKDKDKEIDKDIIKKCVENNLIPQPVTLKVSKYPFTDFWELYGVNKTEFQAGRQWTYLDDDERKRAMEHVPKYLEYCKATKTRVLYPVNYLQDKRYNDEIEQSKEITIDDF